MYISCLLFIPWFFFQRNYSFHGFSLNGINKSATWLACITVCSGTCVGKHCYLLTQHLVTSGSYHTNVNKQTVHQKFRQPQSRFLQRNAKNKQTTQPTLEEPRSGFWQRNANNNQTIHPTLGEPYLLFLSWGIINYVPNIGWKSVVVFTLRNASNKQQTTLQTLSEPQSFSWGTLTNKQTNKLPAHLPTSFSLASLRVSTSLCRSMTCSCSSVMRRCWVADILSSFCSVSTRFCSSFSCMLSRSISIRIWSWLWRSTRMFWARRNGGSKFLYMLHLHQDYEDILINTTPCVPRLGGHFD